MKREDGVTRSFFMAMVGALGCVAVACGGASGTGGTGATGGTGGAGGTGAAGGAGGAGVCPGLDPWPANQKVCRAQADCSNGDTCVAAPIGGCGACLGPQHDCTKDSDCGSSTLVCETYLEMGPCLCGPPEGTKCITRCPDQACAAGTQCSATGHCDPVSCDQGFTCAADLTCKPGGAAADEHGCAPALCSDGFQCAADRECDPAGVSPDLHGCSFTPCSKGFACAAGFECAPSSDSDPHGCKPISCSKGNACPVNFDCDPALPGQGCAKRSCATDSTCDCGACVNQKCEPRIWICDSPPA